MTHRPTLLAAALLAAGLSVAQAQALPPEMVQAARQAVTSNPEVQARWHAFLDADQ